jgi:pimeloyl-ACP methyl ester carboxylesterase
MTVWTSGDVKVDGLCLHYTRTGGDRPEVVLVHGFSDDGLCWTPVAEALEGTYDLIMVDARGHGRSEGPRQGYGSQEMAGDLAGVVAGLGLQRPAVLGHSMGAATALALAGTRPDLVGAILLEDPPAWWAASRDPEADALRWAWMRARLIELKRKTREELIAAQRAESPGWSEAELEPWADAKLRFSFNALDRVGPGGAVDWQATLRRITCPALLITADPALGAIISEQDAAVLKSLIPQLRVAHIPGAGHNVRREQFARYMEAVRAFLGEVTATAEGPSIA